MQYIERDERQTSVGYESLVWVRDNEGREFSCTVAGKGGSPSRFEQLTEQEQKTCMDVSQIIGTERW